VVTAAFFSAKTGSGKRAIEAVRYLAESGADVTIISAIFPDTSLTPIGDRVTVARGISELSPRYDVVLTIDNWYSRHITWALNVARYAKQNLGARLVVEATGDYLVAGKAHLEREKPDIYHETIIGERGLWEIADLVLAVSDGVRREIFADLYGPKSEAVMVLPLARAVTSERPFVRDERQWSVCMAGSTHPRNRAAFIEFIESVWPLVTKLRPNLRLEIFGGGTDGLRDHCKRFSNIDLLGEVEDFDAALARNLMLVVPADAPGGVKTVAIEALEVGTPIIASQSSITRLGLKEGPGIFSAEAYQEWADKIVKFTGASRSFQSQVTSHLCSQITQYQLANDFETCMNSVINRIGKELQPPAVSVSNDRLDQPSILLVGTYHKTGTVLLQKIISTVAARIGLAFHHEQIHSKSFSQKNKDESRRFVFDYDSRFADFEVAPGMSGVRVVRDPRMMIVSAARYHENSDEAWLHQPRDEFGGLTYQQKIRSFDSFKEKMIFEMRNSSQKTISDMTLFGAKPIADVFRTFHLEDLMVDRKLECFYALFRHLGLESADLAFALTVAVDHSAFKKDFVKPAHMLGDTKAVWLEYYDDDLLEYYYSLFGDAHRRLGYD